MLLFLGVLIVLSGLFGSVFKEQQIPNVVILLLISGAFVFAARTGEIPFISGELDNPEIATVELQQTHRAACIERELASASDVPASLPETVISADQETASTALTDVASIADEKSLVWIFYDQSRRADAEELGEQLLSVDVTVIVEPDVGQGDSKLVAVHPFRRFGQPFSKAEVWPTVGSHQEDLSGLNEEHPQVSAATF